MDELTRVKRAIADIIKFYPYALSESATGQYVNTPEHVVKELISLRAKAANLEENTK